MILSYTKRHRFKIRSLCFMRYSHCKMYFLLNCILESTNCIESGKLNSKQCQQDIMKDMHRDQNKSILKDKDCIIVNRFLIRNILEHIENIKNFKPEHSFLENKGLDWLSQLGKHYLEDKVYIMFNQSSLGKIQVDSLNKTLDLSVIKMFQVGNSKKRLNLMHNQHHLNSSNRMISLPNFKMNQLDTISIIELININYNFQQDMQMHCSFLLKDKNNLLDMHYN